MAHLRIDTVACKGHGLCFFGWSQLFDLREDGIAVGLVDEIPPDLRQDAEDAAAACPERAILIVEAP
ncbi:ferredoxin [Dactylosporangium salmoneum]|uniref:Ferredoxin n=1 Tax=Dactylosporangium salmoneum TaxID=53361 RepID=A0ABN3HHA3_9ACTN